MYNNNMRLRKIIYTPTKGWIASFYGKQIEKDERKTYEPDTKVRAESYDELKNMIDERVDNHTLSTEGMVVE